MRRLLSALLTLCVALPLAAAPAKAAKKPKVRFTTSLGAFTVELDPDAAPKTVANFMAYVKAGFYKGTVFHRVIPSFMIQGGGFTKDLQQKKTQPPIPNEAKQALEKGLRNTRGSIAMARTYIPDSATAQFFINVKDNAMLDYPGQDGAGYCVFGHVVKGLEVVDKIKAVRTANQNGMGDVPVKPVVILSAKAQ